MNEQNIVLIIGAGASFPYGLPLGKELIQEICRDAENILRKIAILPNDVEMIRWNAESFTNKLNASSRPSIDAFLASQSHSLVDLGKQLIAGVLLTKEDKDNLFGVPGRKKPADDWYSKLYNWLFPSGRPKESLPAHKITVITYNYDRSLEHFLFESLKINDGFTESDVAQLMNDIPIIHLHGKLGHLPWQNKNEHPVRFGSNDKESIFNAAKAIKIIHEGTFDEEIRRAHKALSNASSIVFFGFGYDEENLKRLELSKNLSGESTIYGTGYKLIDAKINHIKDIIVRLSNSKVSKKHRINIWNCKNSELFDKCGLFL